MTNLPPPALPRAPHLAWWRLWNDPPEVFDTGWVRLGVAKVIARGGMPPDRALGSHQRLMTEFGSSTGRYRLYRLLVEAAPVEPPRNTEEVRWFASSSEALQTLVLQAGLLCQQRSDQKLRLPPQTAVSQAACYGIWWLADFLSDRPQLYERLIIRLPRAWFLERPPYSKIAATEIWREVMHVLRPEESAASAPAPQHTSAAIPGATQTISMSTPTKTPRYLQR